MDGLIENIEGLKYKLCRERKENRRLEEDLCGLEKRITKELRSVKRGIVDGLEVEGKMTSKGSRLLLTEASEERTPKVEIII